MKPDPYTDARRSWKPKHYGFLRDLANGASKKAAWSAHCGKNANPTGMANRWLAANAEAAEDWLARLRAEVARAEEAKAVMTMLQKREVLRKIVFANHEDAEDGKNSYLFASISKSSSETSSSITTRKHDIIRAIELDAKIAGELKEKITIEPSDTLTELMQEIRSQKQ